MEIKQVEVILVVRVEFSRGNGVPPDDAIYPVTQYWSLQGSLLAENDPNRAGEPCR